VEDIDQNQQSSGLHVASCCEKSRLLTSKHRRPLHCNMEQRFRNGGFRDVADQWLEAPTRRTHRSVNA
jgi:hypothetical protein